MPDLGSAKLTLVVAGEKFKKGLADAKGQAEKTTKGITGAFGKAQQSIQGAASKVPVFGGGLAALASPAGLASAGIALVVGGLTKMVSKTLDVGRALGASREATGVAAEQLQIYGRAIEETNGDASSFDNVVLRLSKSIGDANQGNKAAQDGFNALGLSWEDLADKSPDEALKAVVGAANESLNATDGAAVKAALLGRSFTNLGGFANLTTDEIGALTDSVKDTAVTMSGEGVTAVDQYDAASRSMRDSFGSIVTEVGMALIPTITQLFGVIRQLMPVIKVLISIALLPLQRAVTSISAAVNIISALLRGDFTGALSFAKNFFIDTATQILDVGAKIVGLFNKDMAASIAGLSDDLKGLKTDSETEMPKTEKAVSDASGKIVRDSGDASTAIRGTGTATEETAKAVKKNARLMATAWAKAAADMVANSALRVKNLLADYAKEVKAEGDRIRAAEAASKALKEENEKFRTDKLAADKAAWGITEIEYKLAQGRIKTLTAQQYADLLQEAEEFGIDDLALLVAHNGKMEAEQNRSIAELAQADADAKIAQAAADVTHRADLVTALDTHLAAIATQIETADGAEKTALETQLADLKTQRDTAYAATKQDLLAAKQSEIDAVGEQIKTAQGAELATLQAHLALLVAQYGTMVADINAETAKIVKDIKINIGVTGTFGGGASSGDAGDASGSNTAIFNDDGTMQTGHGQDFHLDSSGNAFYDEALRNPVSDELQNSVNEALGHDNLPGSQHGSLVRGVRSPLGRMIRVGENGTDEGIFPLPPGLLDSLRRGGTTGRASSRPLYLQLRLPNGVMEDILVGTLDDLARQDRVTVDITGGS